MKILISIQQPVMQWQIPAEGVETLRKRFPHVQFIHATSPEERAAAWPLCDAAYTWILKDHELAQAPKLRWVHTSAVAVETLCLPELFARDVAVSNTRGVQAVPIAEHVIAVTLALAKQLPFVIENQQQARWAQNEFIASRLPWLLKGRTLGLIGVGTIGAEIAKRAEAFGMRVIALRRRPAYGTIGHVDRVYGKADLDDFLGQCHVLVICAPLTPETQSLMGQKQFEQLPKGAVVINVGRAKIIRHRGADRRAAFRTSGGGVARRVSSRAVAAGTSALDDAECDPHAAHVGLPPGSLGRGHRSVRRQPRSLSSQRAAEVPGGT